MPDLAPCVCGARPVSLNLSPTGVPREWMAACPVCRSWRVLFISPVESLQLDCFEQDYQQHRDAAVRAWNAAPRAMQCAGQDLPANLLGALFDLVDDASRTVLDIIEKQGGPGDCYWDAETERTDVVGALTGDIELARSLMHQCALDDSFPTDVTELREWMRQMIPGDNISAAHRGRLQKQFGPWLPLFLSRDRDEVPGLGLVIEGRLYWQVRRIWTDFLARAQILNDYVVMELKDHPKEMASLFTILFRQLIQQPAVDAIHRLSE